MFLNKLGQQPLSKATSHLQTTTDIDYAKLVRFLIQPFLESPDSLSVDCETSPNTARVWIRVAFEGEDKGRVFGRGGRNIQAIRTVITAAATLAGHSVHLDVYGSEAANTISDSESGLEEGGGTPAKPREQRDVAKPVPKPRPRPSVE